MAAPGSEGAASEASNIGGAGGMAAEPSAPSPVGAEMQGSQAQAVGMAAEPPAPETTPLDPMAPDPMAPDPMAAEEPPVVCDAVTTVLQPSCGGGDCHNGVGIGNFAVGEEEALSFVDKPPVFNAGVCGLMIDSSNPERSFILTKVTGSAPYNNADCKERMPIGTPLKPEEVDCLRSWLEQFRR